MHGNRKLCRIFLGKCIGAPYEILTTKKPPNLSMRGLFVWLINHLLDRTQRLPFVWQQSGPGLGF